MPHMKAPASVNPVSVATQLRHELDQRNSQIARQIKTISNQDELLAKQSARIAELSEMLDRAEKNAATLESELREAEQLQEHERAINLGLASDIARMQNVVEAARCCADGDPNGRLAQALKRLDGGEK